MVLAAYFDESIRTNQGSEPICVAGYLFKPSGYKHFVRKWDRVLKAGPTPTTHFHMSHLYYGSHEYKDWTDQQRTEVLRQAVDAIRKHAYGGISVLFSQAEFEEAAPDFWPNKFGSMYSVACTIALRVTGFWLEKRGNTDQVAYFFENGQEFWDEANAILGKIKHPELRQVYRYHSHTSVGKRDAYGIQAADMLAWIMTRLNVGVPNNATINSFAPAIYRLVEGRDDRHQLFHPSADQLRSGMADFRPSVVEAFR